MPRFDLCIPYSEKDELKNAHKLRFDMDKKIWYVLCNSDADLPDDLKKYKKMFVDIDYDDKDIMKKKYKSLRFDFLEKCWYCSLEDFLKMSN